MAVGAIETKFYAEFIRLLFDGAPPEGLPGQHEAGEFDRSRSVFKERFAGRTQAEWVKVFEGTDACVAPVAALSEAPSHPHLAARSTYVDVDGITQPGVAPRFSRTPGGIGPRARAGEHSREVLADWGVPDAESLLSGGVITQS
jgi:alpha-methylacyl-CoA racemase